MGLIGGLEQRLERAVEGFFARLFRSGVHPIEIGKRLSRVMEDGKTVALRRVYVPHAYRITLSTTDFEHLQGLQHRIVEELETFVAESARVRGWTLTDSPRVAIESSTQIGRGEFRVEAEAVNTAKRPARSREAEQPTRVLRTSGPALVVMGDDGPMETITLRERLTIGRQADNDLVLIDPAASRHHAEVVRDGGGYLIRDLESRNHTFVDDAKITQQRLRDGNRILIGQTVIEYRA